MCFQECYYQIHDNCRQAQAVSVFLISKNTNFKINVKLNDCHFKDQSKKKIFQSRKFIFFPKIYDFIEKVFLVRVKFNFGLTIVPCHSPFLN